MIGIIGSSLNMRSHHKTILVFQDTEITFRKVTVHTVLKR